MFHERMKYTYIGVDSHKETHYAVILNCFCERLGEFEFRNAPSSFEGFIEKMKEFQLENTTLTFGFEDTSEYGASIVRHIIKAGFEVRHCNASLVATERKSSNILHKTDDYDAECVARILINKFNLLPVYHPKDEYDILESAQ